MIAFARRASGANARERAVALYYLVRDGFRYDPYRIDLSAAGMRASRVLESRLRLVRAQGGAAGGGRARRRHSGAGGLRRRAQPPVDRAHAQPCCRPTSTSGTATPSCGWTARWVKATPAFNLELCERFGILPLDWDGRTDSLYHPYDREGRRHMEYVNQRGSFDDMPVAQIAADFAATYPGWVASAAADADFEQDAARESLTAARSSAQLRRGRWRSVRLGRGRTSVHFTSLPLANSHVTLEAPPSVQR